jgi:hypothetical protein
MSTPDTTATPEASTEAPERLRDGLLTGPDARAFCGRIRAALAAGYVLHGSPAVTFDGTRVIAAQALVLPGTPTPETRLV